MAGDAPELVAIEEQPTAVIRGKVPMAELAAFFDRAFQQLPQVLADQGVEIAGAAFALHHSPPTDVADLEVGFPAGAPVAAEGDVVPGQLPGGEVARLVHAGAFEGLGEAWGRLQAWIEEQGLVPAGPMWETYLTEPRPGMDPAELRTELSWPVTR